MGIKLTAGESFATGALSKGCQLCIKGKKLVLFVTGKCNQKCFYCTLSNHRWQTDNVFANERPIKNDTDIIDEVKKCGSKGAGITGGEPLLVMDRVVDFIKLLKKSFGKQFHIHMYTNGTLATDANLKRLKEAGLDEIRIHMDREAVKRALKLKGWKVGMEVPCMPGKEEELCQLVDYLEKIHAHFLNLNELEFSDRNIAPMERLGLTLLTDSLTAVKGSHDTAMKVLKYAEKRRLPVHFCTAKLKMNHQLRNRLFNRASRIKRPFEQVTPDGFLIRGEILTNDLQEAARILRREGVTQFAINTVKHRIELSAKEAEKLSKSLPFKVAIVKEYPSAQPWEWELTPLNYRPDPAKAKLREEGKGND